MNKRFSRVRKDAGLTQDEFANRIGLTKNFVSLIETDKREPSDRTIKDVCREFDINEEWLKSGKGKMSKDLTRSEAISDFMVALLKDEDESFRRRLIEAFVNLDVEDWKDIERIAKKMVSKKAE